MNLDEAVKHLDRPRYRLQRPLFLVLAWTLHPSGGGTGLVVALVAVGIAGVVLAGLAAGALSTTLGGGTWPAFVVAALPGSYIAPRITVADTLPLGLAPGVLLALETGRARLDSSARSRPCSPRSRRWSCCSRMRCTVGRRNRSRLRARRWSPLPAGGWVALRFPVDSDVPHVKEFTWPFGGIVLSVDQWLAGST